jgi:hypothetical protein
MSGRNRVEASTVRKMSHVLDLLDHATFDVGRATGSASALQCIWVYSRPIDADGLRQFHTHLERGRLSRCIERSPLPFGRHRWIASQGSSDIEFVASARRREELDVWLTEQVHTPLDCEHGPGWHLAVLPFTDGGCAVSMVVSHCLTDGIGLCEALTDAALGRDDPINWPSAASRGRWRALREDTGQTVRDIPAMGRAVVTAIRLGRSNRNGIGGTPPATPAEAQPASRPVTRREQSDGDDGEFTLPMATVFVDADQWKTRARALGGTSNALLVGVAARLAQRGGRAGTDGSIIVMVPVNKRDAGDTRANAITNVGVTVDDPMLATTDLREVRAAIWHSLVRHREMGDDEQAVNAIVPLLPKRILVGFHARAVVPRNVVGSSNLGMLDPAASRPDGTDADCFAIKNNFVRVTEATMRQRNGMQTMLSGIACGQVFITAVSHHPDRSNSNDELRQELWNTLNDFGLTGALSLTGTHL